MEFPTPLTHDQILLLQDLSSKLDKEKSGDSGPTIVGRSFGRDMTIFWEFGNEDPQRSFIPGLNTIISRNSPNSVSQSFSRHRRVITMVSNAPLIVMLTQTSASTSSSAPAPPRKTYTSEQWQNKIDAIKVSKTYSPFSYVLLMSDLNVLIMNYLVHQGYPSSAVSFAREANLALSKESIDSITARMKVRNKIHAGDIEGAIHDINTLNPQVPHPLCFV